MTENYENKTPYILEEEKLPFFNYVLEVRVLVVTLPLISVKHTFSCTYQRGHLTLKFEKCNMYNKNGKFFYWPIVWSENRHGAGHLTDLGRNGAILLT
jgi:hypothetical protein